LVFVVSCGGFPGGFGPLIGLWVEFFCGSGLDKVHSGLQNRGEIMVKTWWFAWFLW